MADEPEALTADHELNLRMMDFTLHDMGVLADIVGYEKSHSCVTTFPGEDFYSIGNRCYADEMKCHGDDRKDRLVLNYTDWHFEIKNMKYRNHVVQEMPPEILSTGYIINNENVQKTVTLNFSTTVTRQVTHTNNRFKELWKLGIYLKYPPPLEIKKNASYKFRDEAHTEFNDETNNKQSQVFPVVSSWTLKPYSAVKWDRVLLQTRTLLAYKTTVLAKFSIKIQGVIRGKNLHELFQPPRITAPFTVHYRFGNSSTPFYRALKEDNDTNASPWMWRKLIKNKNAKHVISRLLNEKLYLFQLSGEFADIVGKNVTVSLERVAIARRQEHVWVWGCSSNHCQRYQRENQHYQTIKQVLKIHDKMAKSNCHSKSK